MISITKAERNYKRTILLIATLFISTQNFAQGVSDWHRKK